MDDLKNIVECFLFLANEPLNPDRIKACLGNVEINEIKAALIALESDYHKRRGGIVLTHVAGGYQFRTRPEYSQWIKEFLKPNPVRISKAALETLAIIAYKQPLIRADLEQIRGVDCGGVLRMLMERKLIRVLGRKEIPGRPLIYATTKRFLEVFELMDLSDLPSPKEIAEFGQSKMEVFEAETVSPIVEDGIKSQLSPIPLRKKGLKPLTKA